MVFRLFGDRVKIWFTINEPLILCDLIYNTGAGAPGILEPDLGGYDCTKNVLIAHAKAYRIYEKEFRALYNGE